MYKNYYIHQCGLWNSVYHWRNQYANSIVFNLTKQTDTQNRYTFTFQRSTNYTYIDLSTGLIVRSLVNHSLFRFKGGVSGSLRYFQPFCAFSPEEVPYSLCFDYTVDPTIEFITKFTTSDLVVDFWFLIK